MRSPRSWLAKSAPARAPRIQSAVGDRVDAFIDTFGAGYVDLAHELGVPAQRVNTVVDFHDALDGRASIAGTNDAGEAAGLQRLVDLVAAGELGIPIATIYPLTDVRKACQQVAGDELLAAYGEAQLAIDP